jgi:hypothetical protein
VRLARSGPLVDAYPAGAHDRELAFSGTPTRDGVSESVDRTFAADPRCRRVVLPLAEDDLAAIARAEEAGFRFVVNVETRAGAYALLVAEPEWVLAEPHLLEDIPIKE